MRIVFAAAFAAALAAVLAAPAQAGTLIDLAVVDRETGQILTQHHRDGRAHVAGAPDHRYAIRLTNRSGGRVLAVLSVDGVNAVTGETADPGQNGYVLGPWESTEILGWRKSLHEVAQFTFTALPDSYAALTGRPDDVGVIGVAAFRERTPIRRRETAPKIAAEPAPPVPAGTYEEKTQSADAAAPQARAVRPAERLGTGHGERETSSVTQTRFVRASERPAEQVAVWYDSYRNLVARGIIVRPVAERAPQPFPGAFVADPPRR